MKIAVAQTRAVKGDIDKNITNHERMVERAVAAKADVIFFSELSITGYEPTLAKQLATHQNDSRFDTFQRLSDAGAITICAGVPTVADDGICISMVIFQPQKERLTYSKQQVHADELPYFVHGQRQLYLPVGDTVIAPAICYESLQPGHSDSAVQAGATVYVSSAAKSARGVEKAMAHFPSVAKKHSIPVLLANCVGVCDDFESVGNSAVWNRSGALVGQLDRENEGLLVFDSVTEEMLCQ